MPQFMKLALAICIITSVIIDLCNAEAKAKKQSRHRRCPSACLRRIRQLVKVCSVNITKSYVSIFMTCYQ
jgi:hypothetical protein